MCIVLTCQSIDIEVSISYNCHIVMKEIKAKHYINTVIYSVDMIIRLLKFELKQKVDSLDMGITSEQFVVLDTIFSEKGIYQQKLSEILLKDKSNTTRILKVLEEKGLITRDMGKANNRLVYILNVTEKGRHLVEDNMPKIKNFILEMFGDISDDEIELLHNLSKKFQSDLSYKPEMLIK